MATFTAGQVLTAAQLNAIFDPLSTAWTAYTPVWFGSTTNPTVGNGTISGAYLKVGKLCHFRINVACGSTTNFGVGSLAFGVPVAPVSLAIAVSIVVRGAGQEVFQGLYDGSASGGQNIFYPVDGTTVLANTNSHLTTTSTIAIAGSYESV